MKKIRTDFSNLGVSVVLDLETTGVEPSTDRIVAIALIRVDLGNVALGPVGQLNIRTETLSEVLDPTIRIPSEAARIHGYSDALVQGKPKFIDKAPEFLEFIEDFPIISHNMGFDGSFLDHEFRRARKGTLRRNERYCTMLAAHERACLLHGRRMKWPRLSESGQYVGMSISQSEVHDPVEDATNALRLCIGLKTTFVDPVQRKVFRYA